ncbi:MAG: prepilin-type N-terminal cleavage/methylation domain-containing protein [bacterium]|nr:prepilin-type N-terminal cleavage/methylation domain-containing protein [bacterium]
MTKSSLKNNNAKLRTMNVKLKKGFTLIELLIVVAIIAILAAIAIPNFLAAQTRSKVARVQKEMQTLATALESYHIDNTAYPPGFYPKLGGFGIPGWQTYDLNPYYLPRLVKLSTPISYISSIPKDIFNPGEDDWTANKTAGRPNEYNAYVYYTSNYINAISDSWTLTYSNAKWRLASYGPRLTRAKSGGLLFYLEREIGLPQYEYDPTNGTISPGFVTRHGP